MSADLTVVISTLNGAAGVDRCLHALAKQTIRPRMEIIVVDDGSTDETAEVARAHGVTVISHPVNLGAAAGRNTGVRAASADVVAFLDDDCEPGPDWARQILSGYDDAAIAGVTGPVVPYSTSRFMLSYLTRHNPLEPLDIALSAGSSLSYRLLLYVREQWKTQSLAGRRDVYTFAGANMSFRRKALFEVGLLDERFRFGCEDVDLCMRVNQEIPGARLVLVPEAQVVHHFDPRLRDTMRRDKAYGRGQVRLFRKWPSVLPKILPGPFAVLALPIAACWLPVLGIPAVLLPILLYPTGLRAALRERRVLPLADGYVELAQEVMHNIGFAQGCWRYRGNRWMGTAVAPEPLKSRTVRDVI
jgi:GT2 family glycosyltransferase